MYPIESAQESLLVLIQELGFSFVGTDRAVGNPGGVPTSLTVLGVNPPCLLFAFRVNPEGHDAKPALAILDGVPYEIASASVDVGFAWLTLRDLSGLDVDAIRLLLASFADALSGTDLAITPGCLRCGTMADTQLICVDQYPTRLCPACLQEAAREKQEREAELNRPSLAATIGLPAVCLFVIAAWAGMWTLLDLGLEWFEVKTVFINRFTSLIGVCLLGAAGALLGLPLGNALRRTVALRHAPKVSTTLAVLGTAAGGELIYIAILLFRMFGIFDVGLAAQLLTQVLASYSGFWVVMKLLCLAITWVLCYSQASHRETVPLDA